MKVKNQKVDWLVNSADFPLLAFFKCFFYEVYALLSVSCIKNIVRKFKHFKVALEHLNVYDLVICCNYLASYLVILVGTFLESFKVAFVF